MKLQNIISLFIFSLSWSCIQTKKDSPSSETAQVSSVQIPKDSLWIRIYDFINVLISEQKLDTSYGLEGTPFGDMNLNEPDSLFLKKLLIDPKTNSSKPIKTKGELSVMPIGFLDKCLTNDDIAYMLQQKEITRNFIWDTSKTSFTNSNSFGEKYSISIPLFSKDYKTILIAYENLMGTGHTVLFRKENDKWSTQIGNEWIH